MAEYIDKKAMLEQIAKREPYMVGDKSVGIDAVRTFIANHPAVDAVPVVRCKDCVNSAEYPWRPEDCLWCPVNNRPVYFDDFCSDGVKKEEDENGRS